MTASDCLQVCYGIRVASVIHILQGVSGTGHLRVLEPSITARHEDYSNACSSS